MKRVMLEQWKEGTNTADMGKVVNEFHHNRLCSLLKDHQGRVMIGNANAHEDGKLVPTVILEPSKDSSVMRDEIFGPILPVYTY